MQQSIDASSEVPDPPEKAIVSLVVVAGLQAQPTTAQVWTYHKKHKIADLCSTKIAEVSDYARWRLKSMQRRPTLISAFWKQAELAL